jgi:hypothetical protein
VLAILAIRYGARAGTYLAEHGTAASLVLAGMLGAGFATYLVWRKAQGLKNR